MAKSIFIEGTDGSGKSSIVAMLKDLLEARGESVLVLREPGGTDYYEALRDIFLNSPHEHPPISDALLATAGRAANIDATKKALSEGRWVISDRAYPSGLAYQMAQGISKDDIWAINQFALGDFDYDYKILLDVSAKTAMERVNTSGTKKDNWESRPIDFFESTVENYRDQAREHDYSLVDAEASLDEVFSNVKKILEL